MEKNLVAMASVPTSSGIYRVTHFRLIHLFFPFDVDVVLGVQWLRLVGNIVTNYKDLTMSFPWNGKTMTITSESSLSTASIQLNKFKRLSASVAIASCFQLIALPPEQPLILNTSPISEEVQQVLDDFQPVFAIPTKLPPCRLVEHQIVLEPDTKPIYVRPYRYPHFQKTEIGKLVHEMLASSVIRPSTSPYFSLVLLVKKKKMVHNSFVLTTAPSTSLLFHIIFRFLLLMKCLMNYLVL